MNESPAHDCEAEAEAGHRWFVAQIKPNCVAIAQSNLLHQGFEIFAPFEELVSRSASQFKLVRRQLFPGYLFVGHEPAAAAPWRAINSTYGVSRLVAFTSAAPAEVPGALINSLRAGCDDAGKLLPPAHLKLGDQVSITSGPFADFTATVISMAPQQRIWVLLDVLGSTRPVAVSGADVRLAG